MTPDLPGSWAQEAARAPGPSSPRRADRIFAALALCVPLALWLPRLGGPLDLRFDAGVYHVLGDSLAQGKGYRLLNEPGEPRGVQYPPLLPAMVALARWASGSPDPAAAASILRPLYTGLSLLLALLTYILARRFLTSGWAFLATTLTSLSLYTYYLSDTLFSELPYAVVSLALLGACEALSRLPHPWSGRAGTLLGGLLFAAAFLLRTAAVALGAAWVAQAALQRRWLEACARAALCLAPFLAWQAYVRDVQQSPEYRTPAYAYQRAPYQFYNVTYGENLKLFDPFAPERGAVTPRRLARRVARNGVFLLQSVGESISAARGFWTEPLFLGWKALGLGKLPPRTDRLAWLALVPLSLMALCGVALMGLRGAWLASIYTFFALGLMCLTPWPEQFLRYLMPLTPLLAIGCVLVASSLASRAVPIVPGSLQPWVARVLLAAALGMEGYVALGAFRSRFDHPAVGLGGAERSACRLFYATDEWYAVHEAFQWLRANAPPDAIIGTSIPQWGYLQTGLRCVMPPLEANTDEAQELIDGVPIRYLILDRLRFTIQSQFSLSRYAEKTVEMNPDVWRFVHGEPGGPARIYERIRDER